MPNIRWRRRPSISCYCFCSGSGGSGRGRGSTLLHLLLLFIFLLMGTAVDAVGGSGGAAAESGHRQDVPCPEACTCEAEEVRCENSRTMRELPRLLPHNDTLKRLLVSRVNVSAVTNASFPHLHELTTLDLHNNRIDSLADGAFLHLPSLTTLILRRNALKQLSQNAFLGLDRLQVLDLSWNCLKELHAGWFQHLTALRVLDLARNEIEPVQLGAFQGLGSLQVLNLTRNKLTKLSSQYLGPLTSLSTLMADDNSIEEIEDNTFASQGSSLTRLSLKGNIDLTHVQAGAFVAPPKTLPLQELWLKGTHLKEVPVDMLRSLPELRTLDLSQTGISVVRGHSFSQQGRLLNLTLDSLPALTTVQEHAFIGLDQLQALVISNNPLLTNISWGAFRNLSGLRYLDLHNNHLETLYSGQAHWQDIHVVDLRGNPLRCDCHASWVLTLLKDKDDEKNGAGGAGGEEEEGGGRRDNNKNHIHNNNNNANTSSSDSVSDKITSSSSSSSSSRGPGLLYKNSSTTCTNISSSSSSSSSHSSSSSSNGMHGGSNGNQVVSTAAFTRQMRCHMPPRLYNRCLTSLSAHDFRCPQAPAPRTREQDDDRRLMVAAISAGLAVVFLITCGLLLKFRHRLCSACGRQYRYRAHRSGGRGRSHGVNGSSPHDIVELETTQLEDCEDSDPDLDTTTMRP